MGNTQKILSTALLPPGLVNKANTNGYVLDVVPFIQVTDITDHPDVQAKLVDLYQQEATVIFTSTNAVYAVCETPFFKNPDWHICCLENATQKALLKYFNEGALIATAAYATTLAQKVLETVQPGPIVFFCGNLRLDKLPSLLTEAGYQLEEVVVYNTVETPVFIEQDYNAVLFLSPSAVNSYFNANVPEPDLLLCAIGQTTAAAIRQNADNPVLVASTPSKEVLLVEAMNYLASKLPV